MATKNVERRLKIKMRLRKRISGTSVKPRLTVFRSNKEIYAQVIDDVEGKTLVAASSKEKDFKGNGWNIAGAEMVGKIFAERMAKAGIKDNYYFDRGRYLYHGRIKALGDSMRANGMKI